MRKLNIGLTEEQRQGVVELLNHDLSDAYLLQIKTKKYHWDVVGPHSARCMSCGKSNIRR